MLISDSFDGFDSKVLEFKLVSHMTGNLGRKVTFSCMMCVGNGRGLVGTANAKATMGATAVRKVRAAGDLPSVGLAAYHTVYSSQSSIIS